MLRFAYRSQGGVRGRTPHGDRHRVEDRLQLPVGVLGTQWLRQEACWRQFAESLGQEAIPGQRLVVLFQPGGEKLFDGLLRPPGVAQQLRLQVIYSGDRLSPDRRGQRGVDQLGLELQHLGQEDVPRPPSQVPLPAHPCWRRHQVASRRPDVEHPLTLVVQQQDAERYGRPHDWLLARHRRLPRPGEQGRDRPGRSGS